MVDIGAGNPDLRVENDEIKSSFLHGFRRFSTGLLSIVDNLAGQPQNVALSLHTPHGDRNKANEVAKQIQNFHFTPLTGTET